MCVLCVQNSVSSQLSCVTLYKNSGSLGMNGPTTDTQTGNFWWDNIQHTNIGPRCNERDKYMAFCVCVCICRDAEWHEQKFDDFSLRRRCCHIYGNLITRIIIYTMYLSIVEMHVVWLYFINFESDEICTHYGAYMQPSIRLRAWLMRAVIMEFPFCHDAHVNDWNKHSY